MNKSVKTIDHILTQARSLKSQSTKVLVRRWSHQSRFKLSSYKGETLMSKIYLYIKYKGERDVNCLINSRVNYTNTPDVW